MSSTDTEPNTHTERACEHAANAERIATRDTLLGENMKIRRALPTRQRRTVGAWCFLDHFGPLDVPDVRDGPGMRVGPHPHIGLQSFTWPIEGEILHRDSLGYQQLIRPGQVNLMTAGRGIAHAEEAHLTRAASARRAVVDCAARKPPAHRAGVRTLPGTAAAGTSWLPAHRARR